MVKAVPSASAGATASTDSTTVDPRGIPGWEKVGELVEKLLGLTGIAVSVAQAERLKALYNALEPYDKKAIEVHLIYIYIYIYIYVTTAESKGSLLQSQEFWIYNKRAHEEVIIVGA